MDSKVVMQLLQERGLKIASASSSIPNIYANALIEELKNSSKNSSKNAVTVSPKSPPVSEKITPSKGKDDGKKISAKDFPRENTPEDQTMEKPVSPGGNFTPFIEEEKGKLVEAAEGKESGVIIANAHGSPPKGFIKIPLPKATPPPLPFLSEKGKNKIESKIEIPSTLPLPTKDENVASESDVEGMVLPSTQGQSPSRTEISAQDQGREMATNGIRRRTPMANFDEKRTAPTVRFQFTPKNSKNEPFNAIKITGVPGQEGDQATELKSLICKAPLIVRDFAQKIGLKPFQLISELMGRGIFASMNQQIADDVAIHIAEKHGFKLEIRQKSDPTKPTTTKVKVEAPKELQIRPPVVCVLGHVDHGKTTLLDTIRHASVVSGEAGGITQHVDAYQVDHGGKKITFLDTPGHAAFSNMRQRGANVTDVAILVVAADDGFMPQTDEALKFAQKANIPIVVAINKMDAKGANVDRVKQQMQQRGITPEEWGGDTLCIEISALKGTHIDELLSLVLLQAEIMELKADYKCPASGVVVESRIDVGRGATAMVIVEKGTLKPGDAIVCGGEYCRVRSMLNERLETVKTATPSMAVRVTGWSGVPNAGDLFQVVQDEKLAKKQAEENEHDHKAKADPVHKIDNVKTLFEAMASQKQKILKLIVKCDVHGTMEALVACLEAIKSDKVKLEILNSGVGAVSKNDIEFAYSSEAIVVGFNVKMDNGVAPLAKNKGVHVLLHDIIYELVDRVREEMAELLDYEYSENHLGTAEVRQVFNLARAVVAGSMVIDGQIVRDKPVRVRRGTKVLFEGKIDSLKRQKEDQSEVRSGFECGIKIEGFSAFEEGDTIESFEMIRHRQML
jgi:translation initiation factor IF-2